MVSASGVGGTVTGPMTPSLLPVSVCDGDAVQAVGLVEI